MSATKTQEGVLATCDDGETSSVKIQELCHHWILHDVFYKSCVCNWLIIMFL